MKTLFKNIWIIGLLGFSTLITAQEEIRSGTSTGSMHQVETILPFTNTPTTIYVEDIDGKMIFEGDIVIHQATSSSGRGGAATADTDKLWSNSVIPYVIATGHPKSAEILAGITELNNRTNICIIPRTTETDYIEYIYSPGKCGESNIGKIGGRQPVEIGDRCLNTRGSAMHETMHAMGFYHEQSRDDRDTYVTINTANIISGKENNFLKYNQSIWHYLFPQGRNIGEYDYNSIMHYGRTAFGRTDTSGHQLETIVPSSSTAQIGQRDSLSVNDIRSINTLYPTNCTRTATSTTVSDAETTNRGGGRDTTRPAIDIQYEVELVPQQTGVSCWAASAAMIVGWRDMVCIDPSEIARGVGYWSQYYNDRLPADDTRMFGYWGLTLESPQSYTVEGFARLVSYGPLWVATDLNGGGHAVVVAGLRGDGTPDRTMVKIYDPWERGMTAFRTGNRGSIYEMTYTEFVNRQETLARREMDIPNAIYVAY